MRFEVNELKLELERIWKEWDCLNPTRWTYWTFGENKRPRPSRGRLTYPRHEPIAELRKRLGIRPR